MLKTGCAVLAMVVGSASAQVNLKGIDWAYIGDAGNQPVPDILSDGLSTNGWNADGVGRVDHTYRISTTPVTVENWFEFVLAWSPYHENHFSTGFSTIGGGGIDYNALTETWSIIPGTERGAAGARWRLAAVYANWLHNDQRNDEASFLSGAYDISTFGGSGGNLTDQFEPSPGAKYWIPTMDEWIKAMHYDPNYNGEGEGGYWLYPHGSDTQPVPGAPGVGETNIGWGRVTDVGSYPDVMSPYGLLDGASGAWEFNPTARTTLIDIRQKALAPFGLDGHIVWGQSVATTNITMGFRLATSVPNAGGLSVVLLMGLALSANRKRKTTR